MNTNCLEGIQCLGCGSEGPFEIKVKVYITVHDDGTDDIIGDVEWDDDDPCICPECGKHGTVADFKVGRRIIAKFHPQMWVKGYAMDVDVDEPLEFDVTDAVLSYPKEDVLSWQDNDEETDSLILLAEAPLWMLDWPGPFWVEVAEAIRVYFNEEK